MTAAMPERTAALDGCFRTVKLQVGVPVEIETVRCMFSGCVIEILPRLSDEWLRTVGHSALTARSSDKPTIEAPGGGVEQVNGRPLLWVVLVMGEASPMSEVALLVFRSRLHTKSLPWQSKVDYPFRPAHWIVHTKFSRH